LAALTREKTPLQPQTAPLDRARHARFDCLAGARAVNDPYDFDTVAVVYELRPTGEHVGPRSPHRLVDVDFVGGPGVP
jgi:hypothetical protein